MNNIIMADGHIIGYSADVMSYLVDLIKSESDDLSPLLIGLDDHILNFKTNVNILADLYDIGYDGIVDVEFDITFCDGSYKIYNLERRLAE